MNESPAAGFLLPAGSLAWREVVRFLRQRSRIIGALLTPVLFWLVIGSGLGDSFRPPGASAEPSQNFLTYFFPGTVLLIVLFTSIFSCISIIEDRREGFLQSVLVAPVPPTVIVAGKIGGSTLLAVGQGILFLLMAPLVRIPLTPLSILESIGVLAATSLALGSLGFAFAWELDSVQGFHAIMNVVLLPMWLLSGALFPISGAQSWVAWLMRLNPLHYALAALRHVMHADAAAAVGVLPSQALCWTVLLATSVISFAVAVLCVARTSGRH